MLSVDMAAMKGFCKSNSLVAALFVLLWILLVVVEVKIHPYPFLKFIYAGSLPPVFVGFYFASWRALRISSKHPAGFAALSCFLMSPTLIFIGGVLTTRFKHMIGGLT
jgi:hypothetical protein